MACSALAFAVLVGLPAGVASAGFGGALADVVGGLGDAAGKVGVVELAPPAEVSTGMMKAFDGVAKVPLDLIDRHRTGAEAEIQRQAHNVGVSPEMVEHGMEAVGTLSDGLQQSDVAAKAKAEAPSMVRTAAEEFQRFDVPGTFRTAADLRAAPLLIGGDAVRGVAQRLRQEAIRGEHPVAHGRVADFYKALTPAGGVGLPVDDVDVPRVRDWLAGRLEGEERATVERWAREQARHMSEDRAREAVSALVGDAVAQGASLDALRATVEAIIGAVSSTDILKLGERVIAVSDVPDVVVGSEDFSRLSRTAQAEVGDFHGRLAGSLADAKDSQAALKNAVGALAGGAEALAARVAPAQPAKAEGQPPRPSDAPGARRTWLPWLIGAGALAAAVAAAAALTKGRLGSLGGRWLGKRRPLAPPTPTIQLSTSI